jgi:hypothetical protein
MPAPPWRSKIGFQMQFLEWLQTWPFSEWVQTSEWGFPILLAFHSMGLAAVVGILVMLDVRVLGFAKPFPVSTFANLMPVAWIGFAVNAISGTLLFVADASKLVTNWAFLLKMACVLLGVIAAAITARDLKFPDYRGASKDEAAALGEPVLTTKDKVVAGVSLLIWTVALVGGRLVAYVADHARMFKVDF